MGKRPKRKVILVLVEGNTDRRTLEDTITSLYESIDSEIEVFFPVIREEEKDVGGDITTTKKVWPRNIESAIYDRFLYDFFDEMKLLPKDITEIIHIVDMDGAYIDDEFIAEGECRIRYTDGGIVTDNRARIIKRNEQKRENVDYLCSLEKITVRQKRVKYSVYYFSSNLDHFLHNDANLDRRMKNELAGLFQRRYEDDLQGFIKLFQEDSSAAGGMSYEESWDYIREGNNSIQRHTNIDVLFKRLLDDVECNGSRSK